MRIDLVSEHASPLADLGGADGGGQNIYVAQLASGLAGRGHEVTVYTRRADPDTSTEIRNDGYRVVHVPAGPPRRIPKDQLLEHMSEFGSELRDRWRARAPDLVHAHFWMSGLASLLGASEIGVPVVQTFHALGTVKRRHQKESDTSPPERVRMERLIAKSASQIVASCSDEMFELARIGAPRARMTVVPCGVNLQLFNPEGDVPRKSCARRLVAVGRLVRRKGFDVAIAALRGLPDTELLIVGGPENGPVTESVEAQYLMRQAERCGVADRVHLLGTVPHDRMPGLLRSADAVVCTPWYEPFGMVPLEAMACGVPVVASAVGGLVDTVVDGITGTLVPPKDPGAVARAVRALFASPTRSEGYGVAGRDRAVSRYSWDRVTGETERIYRRVQPAVAEIWSAR